MVKIYNKPGWPGSPIGECKNGTVYRGTGTFQTPIGVYKDGKVYAGVCKQKVKPKNGKNLTK